MTSELIKRDTFGAILRVSEGGPVRIRRDTGQARLGLRWFGRLAAAREARALRALAAVAAVPRLLAWDGRVLERSYIEGRPMQEAQPRDPAYFRDAHRLLKQLHRRGIAHNDLAKEPNWLVTADGRPALVDFQLAWFARPRSRFLRLLAREDLRHLLKHKRTYCPAQLTPTEKRLLRRRSWVGRLWFATAKPVYRLVTRRLMRWEDNEGRGKQPETRP